MERFPHGLPRNRNWKYHRTDKDVSVDDRIALVFQDVSKNLLGHSPRGGLGADAVHGSLQFCDIGSANALDIAPRT